MKRSKSGVVTFKADGSFLNALDGIENRSDFIRRAVLAALDSACPLCRGTGILTPDQKRHWNRFSRTHSVAKCRDCDATHLVCGKER
ncbi:CopG family transcriptional regulator [Candidatus Sumerlaeota bacterium]|nr:CopG family transcriptional regulator [Candidatus Sumerlaeota bacterium]